LLQRPNPSKTLASILPTEDFSGKNRL
jgi:hypothetical protein